MNFIEDNSEPIEMVAPADEPIEIDMLAGDAVYIKEHLRYSHTLSQIDIDNKYIIISELNSLADKATAQLFVAQCGIKLQYGADYSISADAKISWAGLLAEGQLNVGDTIEIYY